MAEPDLNAIDAPRQGVAMFNNILLAAEGVGDAAEAARVAGNLARLMRSSSL